MSAPKSFPVRMSGAPRRYHDRRGTNSPRERVRLARNGIEDPAIVPGSAGVPPA